MKSTERSVTGGRFRLLLASSSAAALLVGAGAPSAFAQCAVSPTTNQPSVSNAAAINCINIKGITVTGDVTNTSTGVLTANGAAAPSKTGITINTASVGGNVVNAGTITAKTNGVFVTNNAIVSGAISNGGTISAGGFSGAGIRINVSTFTGGISNSGTISVGGNGILVAGSTLNVSTFAGGIANSGTISAADGGIVALGVSTFAGGITNSGTISAGFLAGIFASGGATFTGGITNSGKITEGHFAGISADGMQTFAGGITNSGTISAATAGIIAHFISAFAGGITNSGTISAGFLAGIVAQNISTFAGGISNSGTISGIDGIVANAFMSTFAGGITNSGRISAGFNGIVVSGVSTFAGGISNSGTISAATVGINADHIKNFAGGISNSGTISAGDVGIFVGTINTFAGGISNSGTIMGPTGIIASAPIPVSIFNSGVIDGTGGIAVDLLNNAPGNTFTLGPGYNITGVVRGQGSDTFQLGGSGSGNFDLSSVGTGHQYTGFTTFNVVSGTWTVSNTFGQSQAWNVDGGILAGTGTLPGLNVNAGGTFAPGPIGGTGTMTITGSLLLQSAALYMITIQGANASKAAVGGTATLGGAGVQIASGSTVNIGQTYTILTATTGISGTFNPVVASAPIVRCTLSYDAHDVFLTCAPGLITPLLPPGAPQNVVNVANAVDNFITGGGTLPAGFSNLFNFTPQQLVNALTQLSGEDATGAEHGAFQLMNEFLNLMLDPYVDGRIGGGAGGPLPFAPNQDANLPPDIALAYAGVLKASPKPTFAQRWTAWGASFGGSGTANGDPVVGSNDVKTSTYGYAAGMDYHVSPDTVFGFALAGGGTSWNLAQGLGTGRSDAFLAGLHGGTHQGPFYLAGALAFANNWFTTNRIALGDQLTANFQGQSYAARLEGGYRFAVPLARNAIGVTPYAAIQAQNFHTPAFSETDLTAGGFGLSYKAMNGTDTRSELGARFDDLTAIGAMPLILRAKAAWAHDWVSNAALNASFESLPGASFTVNGAPIPHDSALTSVGAQLFVTPNWSLTAKFDGAFAKGSQTYAGTGTLRYTW